MRTTNTIQEGMARQLVGQKHLTGEIVSHETANGRTTVTSQCSKCGGVSRNISLTMASNAIKYPEQQIITCSWGCKYVPPAAKKETYADVVNIPEHQRTSAQQRIFVEAENAQRNAAIQAPIIAARSRAVKAALWTQRERLLMAIAHYVGATTVSDQRVLSNTDFQSWEAWQSASEEDRAKTNHDVDLYFQNHGLVFEGYATVTRAD